MGRTGIVVKLKRTPKAASQEKLREVVLAWLGHQWDDILGKKKADEAWGWVSIGQDSLLTVGDYDVDQEAPADDLTFWFYRSVDWPMNRAEHYLTAALFRGHDELDDNLEAIGYRLGKNTRTKESVLEQHASLDYLEKPCPVCRYLEKKARK